MKKKMSVNRVNRMLGILIFMLIVLIAGYFVKSRIDTARMKKELAAAELRTQQQQSENDEIDRLLQNGDYYLNQQARGDGEYADPEEDVFIIVP